LTSYSQNLNQGKIKEINKALVKCLECEELLKLEKQIKLKLDSALDQCDSAVKYSEEGRVLLEQKVTILADSLNRIHERYIDLEKKHETTVATLAKTEKKLTKARRTNKRLTGVVIIGVLIETVRIVLF
jgi:hypothetical protein